MEELERYCNKYKMDCGEVQDEVIIWIGGIGIKGWDCELKCNECEYTEEY